VVVGAAVVVDRGVVVGAAVVVDRGVVVGAAVVVPRGVVVGTGGPNVTVNMHCDSWMLLGRLG